MKLKNLENTVIKGDYCIGCGGCAFVNPEKFEIKLDDFGMLKANARLVQKESRIEEEICPFSDKSKNEDELSSIFFKEANHKNEYLGNYIENYVGYVREGEYRNLGSSGGFGKWILNELLERDYVDYVIQVVSNDEIDKLFDFVIFKKGDDILSGSKSAYYPITLVGALNFIKENEGRYAVTSIPCFSKALRSISLHDEIIGNRIKFIIGIVCGHLKSTAFAEFFGWQLGISPKKLRGIEFRGKIEGLKANDKGVFGTDLDGNKSEIKSSKTLLGGDWGHGLFKYKACDYCDDIVGETTDVSIGDAWIKELMTDHRGNNVLVVRNEIINQIIQESIENKRLSFQVTDEKTVVDSQLGGIRHRREGLNYRIFKNKKSSNWTPTKRYFKYTIIPYWRKKIYNQRENVRDLSHELFKTAKEKNDINYFIKNIKPQLEKFKLNLFDRILNKLLK